jgi:hypothetical protein
VCSSFRNVTRTFYSWDVRRFDPVLLALTYNDLVPSLPMLHLTFLGTVGRHFIASTLLESTPLLVSFLPQLAHICFQISTADAIFFISSSWQCFLTSEYIDFKNGQVCDYNWWEDQAQSLVAYAIVSSLQLENVRWTSSYNALMYLGGVRFLSCCIPFRPNTSREVGSSLYL